MVALTGATTCQRIGRSIRHLHMRQPSRRLSEHLPHEARESSIDLHRMTWEGTREVVVEAGAEEEGVEVAVADVEAQGRPRATLSFSNDQALRPVRNVWAGVLAVPRSCCFNAQNRTLTRVVKLHPQPSRERYLAISRLMSLMTSLVGRSGTGGLAVTRPSSLAVVFYYRISRLVLPMHVFAPRSHCLSCL